MARVLLDNVTKVFDGITRAVDNVTLEIADQEFMVIVGPSGCGKTTILRLIAGLGEPTSGTIVIGDSVANNIPPSKRDVAMVFQNYALYPHMTAFENMAFGLKLRRYPKDEVRRRVTEAADLLGIRELLGRKPQSLSGGERQRVALGRAIVRNPKVFLFDEPLSNLDAQSRLTMRAELKVLHRKVRATSIYVTHDQAEAMSLGNRIAVMYNGVIHQVGTPSEVYLRPVDRFVATFLGALPMNSCDGVIRWVGGKPHFVVGRSSIPIPSRPSATLGICENLKAVLGVRPEHISLKPATEQTRNTVVGIVTMIESLGDHSIVYLKISDNDTWITEVEPNAHIGVGESFAIDIDAEKVHVFEYGNMGRNISLASD